MPFLDPLNLRRQQRAYHLNQNSAGIVFFIYQWVRVLKENLEVEVLKIFVKCLRK